MKIALNNKFFWLVKGEDFFQTYLFAESINKDFVYLIARNLSDKEIEETIEKFNKGELEADDKDLCNFYDMKIEGAVWNLYTIA